MGDSRLRCKNCGRELVENERPCPACGSENRLYSIHITEQVEIVDSLEAAHSDAGTGFLWVWQAMRHKISGATKRLAREWLRFDRTDPMVTRKFHRVEEQGEDGNWILMHDEKQEFPAKRRPDRP